jgi:histidine ammonia-lyase
MALQRCNDYVKKVFKTEINSVTDNPNIFIESDQIISEVIFTDNHWHCIGLLAIALNWKYFRKKNLSTDLGLRNLPFLVDNPGLNSGLMIPQYTAASIASQNKQLATPSSVDSIVSSNGQEDHVSMGANGATKALQLWII